MADDKLVPPEASTPSPTTPSAPEILQKFLQENNIEIRLTPPMVRQVEGGGVMVEQPQVVANYKQDTAPLNSIKKS